MRLMELNWQKSQCVKVITADERTRSEVRVWNGPFIAYFFFDCHYVLLGQTLILECLVL